MVDEVKLAAEPVGDGRLRRSDAEDDRQPDEHENTPVDRRQAVARPGFGIELAMKVLAEGHGVPFVAGFALHDKLGFVISFQEENHLLVTQLFEIDHRCDFCVHIRRLLKARVNAF